MRTLIPCAIVLSVALTAQGRVAAEQPAATAVASFRVIVNPQNPISNVEQTFIADAFLKNVTRWPDDSSIRPIDLRPNSTARNSFTKQVLQRSVEAVRAYWQQRIFAGRGVPPPELESEDAVVSYVLTHEGAVAYVSERSDLKGAKALTLTR